jgi:anti-sigma factor RsiW
VTCRELTDFILDYLSGELPAESRVAFERHLSRCTNCHRYLASYQASVALGKAAFEEPDAPVPPDVPEQLVTAILAARKGV